MTEEIQKRPDNLPAYIEQSAEGTENVTTEDARIPRLRIAQAQSPQIAGESPVEGLSVGDAFNDLTNKVYGKGPLRLVILRLDPSRFVEFNEDRQVVEANVPKNDPRTLWTTNAEGKSVKPKATKFRDMVVWDGEEVMALSFKSAGIKICMSVLLGLLQWNKQHQVPIYAHWFTFTPKAIRQEKYNWWEFNVQVDREKDVLTEDEYKKAKALHEGVKLKAVEFDRTDEGSGVADEQVTEVEAREPGSDDDVAF